MNSSAPFPNRRFELTKHIPGVPVLFASGCDRYRNYKAYAFPFRASSHYLFFGGPNKPDHFLLLDGGEATLYRPAADADDEIWHGASESVEEIKSRFQLKAVKTLQDLQQDLSTERTATLPLVDAQSNAVLTDLLGREPSLDEEPDATLVQAVMAVRRCQDEYARESIKEAVLATVELQKTVMAGCVPGISERQLRGLLDCKMASEGWSPSFQPIISIAGEVLHNPYYRNTLSEGDLLLIDCGAEIANGYAGDLTRTVPVSGNWSKSQRAVYDVVDRARDTAVRMVAPGVEFAELHRAASLVIARGLVELGILEGDPEELVEKGVHALFFCHGLGHLVGLDVHDMEDLGDRIGYERGRARSSQFGLAALRLDRKLESGMVVTIEPGYYRIPALLDGPLGQDFAPYLDRERLAEFDDVRGIRIEDCVLVTEDGFENLSRTLPTDAQEVLKFVGVSKKVAV